MRTRDSGRLFKTLGLVAALGSAGGAGPCPAAGWGEVQTAGDIAYFHCAIPPRLERYDLRAERWLEPTPVPAGVSAFTVDEMAASGAGTRAD